MAIPLLLQVGAVPFTSNVNNQGSSILTRRNRSNFVTLNRQQRAVIGQLMTEAAEAIHDIIRQPPQTAEISINTDLTVPPNTPNSSTMTTFEFPDEVPEVQTSSTDDETEVGKVQRKRKRPSSFKKQHHRVVPKKVLTFCEDADDEASDQDLKDNLELKLKLGLLSESQEVFKPSQESSEDEVSSEESDDPEKWNKIGVELRLIADHFGSAPETENELANPFQPMDLLQIINLMLPFSVPRSLWSALLSYAAWKIFKKFQ